MKPSSSPEPFKSLFEDQHLLVLDKPAGLLSQGDHSGDENLVDALRVYFGRHYVGLIHRLDRNTSGVMVVAKRSKSAERLTAQLQDGRLIRRYLALLEGTLAPRGSKLRWENWLIKNEATNETQAFPISGSKPHPDAKKASLQVRVVKVLQLHSQPVSLCEFELETGRSHQIRAQSSAQGHPLVGDKKYGSRIPFTRPALHSHWIEFEHPISHERLQFECPWPRDLNELTGTGELP